MGNMTVMLFIVSIIFWNIPWWEERVIIFKEIELSLGEAFSLQCINLQMGLDKLGHKQNHEFF